MSSSQSKLLDVVTGRVYWAANLVRRSKYDVPSLQEIRQGLEWAIRDQESSLETEIHRTVECLGLEPGNQASESLAQNVYLVLLSERALQLLEWEADKIWD